MYLKSLELHGFKSFPNRTVLTFERGATVIVGPNGSGKSNISDAMRWVLGELSSRNIRGTRMEDVIFGGTDSRRPMGFAEVTVVFDNSDPENRLDSDVDEVSVTRRYYRTGESEYLINKQPKRLRDIYELFMNTGVGREGYSIIGQGKIAEIISKKSEERRNIFEEAAGISKYRHRKEEAEKKLQATEDNLSRVKDILTELESRVGPLEKEAEKAKKGLAIFEEKKRADVSLWLYDTKQIRDDIDEADKQNKLADHDLEILQSTIADLDARSRTLEAKSEENRLRSANLRSRYVELADKIAELRNALTHAESEVTYSGEVIQDCKKRITVCEEEIAEVEKNKADRMQKRREFEELLAKQSDERLEVLAKAQELEIKIAAMKREIEEALDELTVEENAATGYAVRIDLLKNSKATDGNRTLDIQKDIAAFEEKGLELKAEADRCERAASGFKTKIAEKDAIISENAEKAESLDLEKEQITDRIRAERVERDTLTQRADALQAMNEHFEGYAESIKFVMREYGKGTLGTSGKIHGPLSTLIHVEKDYVTAIDTALGASLQNIVVDDDTTAKDAIRALKRAGAGRATFYPISTVRPQTETDEMRVGARQPGFIGRADTLVASDKIFRGIVEFLLLRTLVFDTIDNASEAAKEMHYKVKSVTLDGQVINAGGSFTGGSAKRDSGILSRTGEIATMREKADKLTAAIKADTETLAEIDKDLADAKDASRAAEQEKELLLTLSRSQFAALDTANANYAANSQVIDRLKADAEALAGKQVQTDEEILRLTEEEAAAKERIAALKNRRSVRAEEMGVADEEHDRTVEQANGMQIAITATRKDVESVDEVIAALNERIAHIEEQKRKENEHIEELLDQREGLADKRRETAEQTEALENERQSLLVEQKETDEGGEEFERAKNELSRLLKEKYDSREVMNLNASNTRHKLEGLLEKQEKLASQLTEDYEMTYEDAVLMNYPPVTAENREEIAEIQRVARGRLRALGSYNPGAIEEFAEVKTRYDGLNTQYVDLTNSHDELIGIITRLEGEMRESFVSAFENINHNFGITFRELFGGGHAELALTEPDDVLTSGIEIKAAPPGKIIKSMSLLSGGEQSFVAIALLFAILKVNPTPFCILDEIEAALDEVNVFRFGEYIKKLADDTQFILITHRRGTMEVGNRLYGVTMPQRGISQAIELSVDEIEGKQKELLG